MERCDQALACQRAAAGRRHQHHYHNGRARRAYAFCWNIGLWSTIRWARLMPHVEWTFVCLELRRNFNKDIWGCFSGPDLDERGVYPETAWMSPLNSSDLKLMEILLQDGRHIFTSNSRLHDATFKTCKCSLSKSKLIFSSEVKMVAR